MEHVFSPPQYVEFTLREKAQIDRLHKRYGSDWKNEDIIRTLTKQKGLLSPLDRPTGASCDGTKIVVHLDASQLFGSTRAALPSFDMLLMAAALEDQ